MASAESEWKDTMFGLLKRTGPATASLMDADTGNVYGFDFDAAARVYDGALTGKELADSIFKDENAAG